MTTQDITTSKDGQTSAKNQNSSNSGDELIIRREIPNSPFTAIKHEESGWFAVYGNAKISYEHKTEEDLMNQFEGVNWTIAMNAVTVMAKTIAEAVIAKEIDTIQELLKNK